MTSARFDLECEYVRRDEQYRRKLIQGNGPHGSYKSNFGKDLQAYAIAYEALISPKPSATP